MEVEDGFSGVYQRNQVVKGERRQSSPIAGENRSCGELHTRAPMTVKLQPAVPGRLYCKVEATSTPPTPTEWWRNEPGTRVSGSWPI
ncbi:hypothetical protein J6590_078758 [Homalodisca vitripennis]|nr:hypothetical protein J6590_078758 [Homalodisca vitripennis]